MKVLSDWWLEMDPKMTRQIPFKVFSDFMMRKKIIPKAFESRRLFSVVLGIKITPDHNLKLSQYQKVASNAILRGALLNLMYYIRKIQVRDQKNNDKNSALLSILNYQRLLIVDGLITDEDILGVEAEEVLEAIV